MLPQNKFIGEEFERDGTYGKIMAMEGDFKNAWWRKKESHKTYHQRQHMT